MKVLGTIFSVLGGLIALALLIAAILPKNMMISVSTIIDKPQETVWNYVRLLENQKNYSVRMLSDPNIKVTLSGTDGTVGAIQARDSMMPNVGKGEQEIKVIHEGESYEVEIRFERPFKGTNYSTTSLQTINGKTQVNNTFASTTARPMNLMSLCMKGQLTAQMQQNMEALKLQVEKQ